MTIGLTLVEETEIAKIPYKKDFFRYVNVKIRILEEEKYPYPMKEPDYITDDSEIMLFIADMVSRFNETHKTRDPRFGYNNTTIEETLIALHNIWVDDEQTLLEQIATPDRFESVL